MSLIQWRNFGFFSSVAADASDSAENFQQIFKSVELTCMTHGRGHLIAGDSAGKVFVMDRDYAIACSIQAYAASVSHMQQMKQHNYLFTIGTEEATPSAYPILKAWNMDKMDRVTKQPTCVRTIRIQYGGESLPVTAFAVMENLSHVSIGLVNGVVLLIKGDITRDRFTKQRVLNEDSKDKCGRIVNLTFDEVPGHDSSLRTLLYGVSEITTFAYRWSGSSKEVREFTDNIGGRSGCVTYTDKFNLAVARPEAIYLYGPDGRGACFILDAEKHSVKWFRNYAVIVSQEKVNRDSNVLTVYDLKNKFIAFAETFSCDILFAEAEWGMLHVFTQDRRVIQLQEKDSSTKLDMLFKKNLYPVAINLAVNQNYDHDSVVDILKRYGDHLYGKGDFDSAMLQYIQTIGKLEPSYVIRKFLDAQRIHSLTSYLQALHEEGLATQDHTTLLLNCYTKLRDVKKLDEFIKTDQEIFFDVHTAINVCRSAGFFEHAVYLAKKFNEHEAYIRIQVEDLKNYQDAISYIAKLGVLDAERTLKKYGKSLVTNLPEQTTEFLIGLCVGKTSSSSPTVTSPGSMNFGGKIQKSQPEEFIQIFVNEPAWLIIFLERLLKQGSSVTSTVVWNTLLELYLSAAGNVENPEGEDFAERAMKLLQNPNACYDDDQALILCQLSQFRRGLMYLYEKMKLHKTLLETLIEVKDYKNVIATCIKFGKKDLELWSLALKFFADNCKECEKELEECIHILDEEKVLTPIQIIQVLSKNSLVTLSVVSDFILRRTLASAAQIEQDNRQIESYREETLRMQKEIENLTKEPQVFQVTKCTACSVSLDLPAVHFLCKHSYHLRCLGDNDQECPKCAPEQRLVLEITRNQEESANDHDQFLQQLKDADDGFSVIADYLGRNTFGNTVHSIE